MKGLILILGLLAGWPVLGQAPGSDAAQVLLSAPPPAPVVSANAQTIGNRGSRVFFYWVVANFPVGKSVPYGPAQVTGAADTLTGANYVRVVWSPVTGATTYDVLRTTTAILPNGAANIAVATAVSGTLYDNVNETINSYTVSSASTASGFWRLDNRNYSLPVMTFSADPIVPTFIGTALPSACVVGQKFFKTDATPGANLYLCTSANTWTVNGSSGVCADCVLGAANLTAANRMVRVLSSGTVTETPEFTRVATGQYQIYDPTGPDTFTVRAGSANSAANDIFNIWDGTTKFLRVRGDGTTFFSGLASISDGVGANNSGWYLGSGAGVLWSSTGQYFGAKDVGVNRLTGTPGNLAVTNGGATNYFVLDGPNLMLKFGGTTSSFAGLRGVGATLQARLANNSADAIFTSSNLKQGSGSPEGVVSGVVGDIYQNTTGGAATSAYIKESGVGTTGWVAIGSSSGTGLFQTLINDLRPTITATTLTLNTGRCWGANKSTATAVITAGAGSGSFVAYCTDSQTLVVEDATAAGLTITCTNCTRIQTATPQVPEGLYPVATGTITTGQWAAVTDTRDFTTRFRFQNGTGMATTVVGSVVTEQVDPVQVQMTANDYDVVTRLDATVSTSSAPAKTGTSLPGTCIVGDQYFKSDETAGGNLYGCTTGNVWTKVGPGGAISITDNLYWPFGYGGDTDTKYTPGANVQVVYKITPLATYTLSKLRYRAGTASGYVAFGVVTSNGNTLVTNSNVTCNNATVGADNTNQCTLPGNLTLTAGTTYYVVITADAATSYYVVGSQGGALSWFGGTGNASYIGTATNASTGTGATLAVSVPLGTINAIGGSIAGNQYPSMVYIP